MAFLKKVLSPGSDKDDEIMYQSPEPKTTAAGGEPRTSHYEDGVPQGDDAPTLHTDRGIEKKDHGVLRQIFNPGGGKYDDVRYGETAATQPVGDQGPTTEGGAAALHSKPEAHKEGGIARQIFNPGGHKHDDIRYGTTATAADRDLPIETIGSKSTATTLDTPIPSSNLEINPATMSQPFDAQRYDPSQPSAPGTTAHPSQLSAAASAPASLKDNQSALSIKSGAMGPYAQHQADSQAAGSSTQDQGLPERTFPLGGGTAVEKTRPTSSVYSADASTPATGAPTSTADQLNPTTTSGSTAPKESSPLAYGAGTAGAVGAGTTAMGHEKQQQGRGFASDPQLTGPHHVAGPHVTDTANRLDPHVPGEFPRDDGEDPHAHYGGGGGFGGVSEPATTAQPEFEPAREPEEEHHYGRDAALAGGAGAAGYGAYEVINDRNPPSTTQPPTTNFSRKQPAPAQASYETGTAPSRQPELEPKEEHHYGRNAALAGAAGAGGYGAYEVLNDRNVPSSTTQSSTGYPNTQPAPAQSSYETGTSVPAPTAATASPQTSHPDSSTTQPSTGDATGPASKTLGPHKSNLMNILDPRVQPEPEKMKSHDTTGPWQADTLNHMDPKVTSDPHKSETGGHGYATFPDQRPEREEGGYGKNAALAGGAAAGAGAAGYGIYEAGKGREPTSAPPQAAGTTTGTTGRHPTDTANVLDPRTKPEPHGSQARDTSGPYGSDTLNRADPRVNDRDAPLQDPKSHNREAAVLGGAGAAGAGAYGAHEYSQQQDAQDPKELEKARKEAEKQHKKDEKEAEKEHKKDEKEAEKQHKKDEKEQEKALAHEREKAEKERAKEAEKAAKERHKEEEKQEKERIKEQERAEKEREREERHANKVVERDGRHKLHKEPPEGYEGSPKEKEKKPGFMHRLLHPGEKRRSGEGSEGSEEGREGVGSREGLGSRDGLSSREGFSSREGMGSREGGEGAYQEAGYRGRETVGEEVKQEGFGTSQGRY